MEITFIFSELSYLSYFWDDHGEIEVEFQGAAIKVEKKIVRECCLELDFLRSVLIALILTLYTRTSSRFL